MPQLNVFVRAAICFLFIFLPLQSMDQWFYDRLFRLRGTSHRDTPIVLVQTGLTRLFSADGSSPTHSWNDAFYRSLVAVVLADKPRLTVFGSYYDRVEPASATTRWSETENLFSATLNEENKLIPPPKALTQDENFGFSNLFPDPDNVVRRSHLIYSSGASLALRVYHRLNTEPIKRNLVEPIRIDFRGPSKSFPHYDAGDLIAEKEHPKGRFAGKIVLIGREGDPSSDLETPFGKMSRLELQANVIDTFLADREIWILPRFVTLIFASVAVVVSISIILYFPLTFAWLLLLLFSVLILFSTLFLFSQFKIWFGLANPIFCIFGTHLLMLGYKLSRQEEHQWKIQQEAEYLKEMDQFKNNFISLFSHDLKTPIAKIKAVTDRTLSENPTLPQPVQAALKSIDRTSGELARLISDILKVTKMESMTVELSQDVLDLNRLVETAAAGLRFHAEEKDISIVLDLEPLFSMEGDSQLIQEVITNLVENAIKYSPKGKKVVVRTNEQAGRVRVSVLDNGPGIEPDELPRVTGKFYRGKSVVDTTKGSGLGLYLAKYFVELHQGRLEIRSEPERGTEVSFWLPIPT